MPNGPLDFASSFGWSKVGNFIYRLGGPGFAISGVLANDMNVGMHVSTETPLE
jgi:hypothetical protein